MCVGIAVRRRQSAAQLRPEIEAFIGEMVERHGFSQAELESIFRMAQFQPAIINAISQPATSKPWYEFRPLFINSQRIAMELLSGTAMLQRWSGHARNSASPRKSSRR